MARTKTFTETSGVSTSNILASDLNTFQEEYDDATGGWQPLHEATAAVQHQTNSTAKYLMRNVLGLWDSDVGTYIPTGFLTSSGTSQHEYIFFVDPTPLSVPNLTTNFRLVISEFIRTTVGDYSGNTTRTYGLYRPKYVGSTVQADTLISGSSYSVAAHNNVGSITSFYSSPFQIPTSEHFLIICNPVTIVTGFNKNIFVTVALEYANV